MRNVDEARHSGRPRTVTKAVVGLTAVAFAAYIAACSTARAEPAPGATDAPSDAHAGLGAKYGTRDPRSCAVRTAPARGAPSGEQAAQYAQCEGEGPYGSQDRIALMENMRVQVGGARPYQHVQDSYEDIDPRQPVYPIRGSFTGYSCDPLRTAREIASGFADNRGKNCDSLERPHATGICFRTTFADWHCTLVDIKADVVRDTRRGVAPPG